MSVMALRELLHQQIATAPDELLPEISDFVAFITTRRQGVTYVDWSAEEWRDFTLAQFMRDTDDDVEYSLEDAKEVFHP
jgi:ureidoglycolate hydrolase